MIINFIGNFLQKSYHFIPKQPIKSLPPAVPTEPSVILSKSDSDKSSSQVPPMLQESDKSKSNTKQNSVPPSQSK